MKRLIASAGLAAAIVSGAHSAEVVGAQGSDICAPVYDETNGSRDNSSALRQQIGEYAAGGVEVTVQIYREGTFATEEELYEQTDALYEDCGWQGAAGDRHINFAIVVEPGIDNDLYDVVIGETPGKQISDRDLDAADLQFDIDSDDPGNSTQDDVATYLRIISPFATSNPAQPQSETPLPESQTPIDPINVPLLPIAGATFAIVGSGLITARLLRGRSIKSLAETTIANAKNATTQAESALDGSVENIVGGANDILSIIHEGDAPELDATAERLDTHLRELRDELHELTSRRDKQKGKLWPDRTEVALSSEAVSNRVTAIESLTAEVAQLKQEMDEKIVGLEKAIPATHEQLNELAQTIASYESAGWNLTGYVETVARLTQRFEHASELYAKRFISEPSAIVARVSADLDSLFAEIEKLQTRHDQLGAAYEAQATTIGLLPETTQQSLAKLATATEQYGPVNFEDLDPTTGYDQALAQLRSAHADMEPLTATKSLTAIEQGEEAIARFDAAATTISQLADKVDQRIAEVTRLAEDLPVLYDELQELITDALEDLHEFGDKTTDETRTLIFGLRDKITAGSSEAHTPKPNLYQLSQLQQQQRARLQELAKQARDEAVEMGELYADVRTIPAANASALETLALSVEKDGDVTPQTKNAIQQLQLPTIIPGGTREELRQQVELARDYAERVAKLKTLASTERRNAQEERERAAEAQRRARQAEQRTAEARRNRQASIPSLPRIGSSRSSRSSGSSGGSTRRSSSSSRPKASGGGARRRGGRA
jgi:hypothetical protein